MRKGPNGGAWYRWQRPPDRLPTAAAVDGWREGTPKGFRFAAKGSRYLTHMKRLKDSGPGIERYFDLVLRLGKKLSVVLWQLPPQMNKADPERLAQFLGKLPRRGLRHALEFRSASWYAGSQRSPRRPGKLRECCSRPAPDRCGCAGMSAG